MKIHENGWMSYYKGKELKGFFRLGGSTKVGLVPLKHDVWELITEDRETSKHEKLKSKRFQFSDPKGNKDNSIAWIKEIKIISEKFASREN